MNINTISNRMDKIKDEYYSPSIIEERKQNVTSIDIFSRLLNDRIVFLGTSIDSQVANSLTAQLLYLDDIEPGEPISLYVNSPGGFVSDGLGIYDTIKFIKSPVYTVCTGLAASMGSIILMAGEKGHRAALPHSRILIHQPLGGAYGQASDITIACREIEATKKELETIVANETGKPIKKIHADMDRDYWMTAEEALKYGIIDKIITTRP